jgi:hypothetical protein
MPEKKYVYESSMSATLKLKPATVKAPSLAMEKKQPRAGQLTRKATPEMLAIVLRLIEYFENN